MLNLKARNVFALYEKQTILRRMRLVPGRFDRHNNGTTVLLQICFEIINFSLCALSNKKHFIGVKHL